ncbi:hypothetical protein ZIOFF_032890 [Zingiber officinale]|uniref:Uncharacterized protein n=1 Tax=Zingiber officinale TaxID=94328 RepID=A0A8J5GPN1_ZINOF|nr:hypothetical protein ZIOFF_032890 [Zingiber officinale]
MASCSVSASVSFSASRCRRLYFSDRYRLRYLLLGSLSLPSPNRPLSATPHASKRFSSYGQETVEVVPNPRAWDGNLGGLGYEEDDDEEDDEDEDDRSLDLLVRFLNSVFRKISRRARRAVRAVLPPAIPTKLVLEVVAYSACRKLLVLKEVELK